MLNSHPCSNFVELLVELFWPFRCIKKQAETAKSVPYLRLKNSKRLQSVKYSLLKYPKNPKVTLKYPDVSSRPFEFFNIHSVAKHQKIEGHLEGKKILKKSRTLPRKIKEGNLQSRPLSQILEKVLWLKQGLEPVTAGLPVKFSPTKKWYIQGEVCGLTKKGHCKSRAFFTRKAPTKK